LVQPTVSALPDRTPDFHSGADDVETQSFSNGHSRWRGRGDDVVQRRRRRSLAQPNQTPAEGERWYYRTNRQTNQKCWYLRAPDVETTGATAAPQGTQAGVEVLAQSKASPLTTSQQQELFKEFLQWKIRNGM
jgi:hypothetical protein